MRLRYQRVVRNERLRWALPLAGVVLVALLLRTWNLEGLPPGLHGDEAIGGLEAERILNQGSIGTYSPLALGQPAGPLYLVAPAVALFGHTAAATRLAPALMGTATVAALFFLVRPAFGTRRALLAAAVLGIMAWHIHFARTGFTVESWPFVAVIAAACLMRGIRASSIPWYGAAGFTTGFGIYVYNANYIFMLAVAIFLGGLLIARRGYPLGRDVACVVVFGLAMLGAMVPMARFAADEENGYFQQFRRDSLTSSAEWKDHDSPLARASLVAKRYGRAWERLTFAPKVDIVDGLGFGPILPGMLSGLALAGMAVAFWRHPREPLVWFGIVVFAVAPIGVAMTDDEGTARRLLIMTPFLAMFAGLGLAEGWRLAGSIPRRLPRQGAFAAVVLLAGACAWQNVVPYFSGLDNPATRWAYAHDFTEASRFMSSLRPGEYVYLLSARHSINYETRQWLAPDVQGEDLVDRATGEYTLDSNPARGEPVFVLVDLFRSHLSELQSRYPGGTVMLGPASDDGPAFIAYRPGSSIPAEPR